MPNWTVLFTKPFHSVYPSCLTKPFHSVYPSCLTGPFHSVYPLCLTGPFHSVYPSCLTGPFHSVYPSCLTGPFHSVYPSCLTGPFHSVGAGMMHLDIRGSGLQPSHDLGHLGNIPQEEDAEGSEEPVHQNQWSELNILPFLHFIIVMPTVILLILQ